MSNEKEVQRFYLWHNPINGLTYMASEPPPIAGGTLYVLADEYDTLRRQLAEAEAARERAYDNRDMALQAADHDKDRADAAEAKLALAEQLLRECVENREGLAYETGLLERIDAAIAAGEGE